MTFSSLMNERANQRQLLDNERTTNRIRAYAMKTLAANEKTYLASKAVLAMSEVQPPPAALAAHLLLVHGVEDAEEDDDGMPGPPQLEDSSFSSQHIKGLSVGRGLPFNGGPYSPAMLVEEINKLARKAERPSPFKRIQSVEAPEDDADAPEQDELLILEHGAAEELGSALDHHAVKECRHQGWSVGGPDDPSQPRLGERQAAGHELHPLVERYGSPHLRWKLHRSVHWQKVLGGVCVKTERFRGFHHVHSLLAEGDLALVTATAAGGNSIISNHICRIVAVLSTEVITGNQVHTIVALLVSWFGSADEDATLSTATPPLFFHTDLSKYGHGYNWAERVMSSRALEARAFRAKTTLNVDVRFMSSKDVSHRTRSFPVFVGLQLHAFPGQWPSRSIRPGAVGGAVELGADLYPQPALPESDSEDESASSASNHVQSQPMSD